MFDHTIRYRRALIVAAHLALFAVAYAMAFGLRFDFTPPQSEIHRLIVTVPASCSLSELRHSRSSTSTRGSCATSASATSSRW